MKKNLRNIVSILLLLISVSIFAAPYNGVTHTFNQPDGSTVTVKLYGDEYYIRAETPDGYTVIRDEKTGWICYATLSADKSHLESTGVVYRSAQKSITTQITEGGKHIDLDQSSVALISNEKRKELEGDKPEKPSPIKSSNLKSGTIAGTIKGLCILVDFPDEPATISVDEIKNFCNADNYTGHGNKYSLKKFFKDMSGGKLIYDNVVYGYYRAPKNFATYDDPNYEGGVQEILGMALNQLKAQGFDFSTLTTNQDGTITAINLMFTGKAKTWSQGMWYHKGWYPYFSANGVKTGDYNCSPANDELNIGVVCHENGHMVGKWPDTYKYDDLHGPDGIGAFDLMCWYGSGYNPIFANPYFLAKNGWATIEDIAGANLNITDQANSSTFYRYRINNSTEYYILKALQKTGHYAAIEDEGLTIWHINEMGDNQTWNHEVYLVHANNNIEDHSHACFKNSYNASYTDNTTPNAHWWNGSTSGLKVSNISAAGATMTYQIGSGGSSCVAMGTGTNIEAENYCTMYGIQTETCLEGGTDVGWIDADDYMTYKINAPTAGWYKVEFRVASLSGGGNLSLKENTKVLGSIVVPSTSAWQTWKTISFNVELTAGSHTVTVYANAGGFNINYWKFTSLVIPTYNTKIEAENYSYKSTSPTSEACSEGGLNMGWILNNDWLAYPVTIPAAGVYSVTYRVASEGSGGKIQLEKDAGATILDSISFAGTGGWQNWTSVSQNVTLPAGSFTLGLKAIVGGFNINWIEIKAVSSAPTIYSPLANDSESKSVSYTNPFANKLTVTNPFTTGAHAELVDISGKTVLKQELEDGANDINTERLSSGLYILRISNNIEVKSFKVLKK